MKRTLIVGAALLAGVALPATADAGIWTYPGLTVSEAKRSADYQRVIRPGTSLRLPKAATELALSLRGEFAEEYHSNRGVCFAALSNSRESCTAFFYRNSRPHVVVNHSRVRVRLYGWYS